MIGLSELLELESSEKLELALKTNEELTAKITRLTDLNLTLISKMVELIELSDNNEEVSNLKIVLNDRNNQIESLNEKLNSYNITQTNMIIFRRDLTFAIDRIYDHANSIFMRIDENNYKANSLSMALNKLEKIKEML